jgi:hypothetical protein
MTCKLTLIARGGGGGCLLSTLLVSEVKKPKMLSCEKLKKKGCSSFMISAFYVSSGVSSNYALVACF